MFLMALIGNLGLLVDNLETFKGVYCGKWRNY